MLTVKHNQVPSGEELKYANVRLILWQIWNEDRFLEKYEGVQLCTYVTNVD